MMDPILDAFANELSRVTLNRPRIPYLSNLTGRWITGSEATDPKYWVRHLRHTVRFAASVEELLRDPEGIFLEVGPRRNLSSLVRQHPACASKRVVLSCMRHPQEHRSDEELLLTALGKLWLAGVEVNWDRFHAHHQHHRTPLPTYPFERQRYWIDPDEDIAAGTGMRNKSTRSPDTTGASERVSLCTSHARPSLSVPFAPAKTTVEQKIAAIWCEILGIREIGIHDNFFDLGGHSLMATQLISRIRSTFQTELSLRVFFEVPTVSSTAKFVQEANTGATELLAAAPDMRIPRAASRTRRSAPNASRQETTHA